MQRIASLILGVIVLPIVSYFAFNVTFGGLPDCNDSDTTSTLRQVIIDHREQFGAYDSRILSAKFNDLSLKEIITRSTQDNPEKNYCRATIYMNGIRIYSLTYSVYWEQKSSFGREQLFWV